MFKLFEDFINWILDFVQHLSLMGWKKRVRSFWNSPLAALTFWPGRRQWINWENLRNFGFFLIYTWDLYNSKICWDISSNFCVNRDIWWQLFFSLITLPGGSYSHNSDNMWSRGWDRFEFANQADVETICSRAWYQWNDFP